MYNSCQTQQQCQGPPGYNGRDGKDGKPGRDGNDGKTAKDGTPIVINKFRPEIIVKDGTFVYNVTDVDKSVLYWYDEIDLVNSTVVRNVLLRVVGSWKATDAVATQTNDFIIDIPPECVTTESITALVIVPQGITMGGYLETVAGVTKICSNFTASPYSMIGAPLTPAILTGIEPVRNISILIYADYSFIVE